MNTQKPNTPEINLDLSHRVKCAPGPQPTGFYDLIDGIEQVTDRATAVLNVIQSLCNVELDDEGRAEIGRINPEIIYFSLDSVLNDLKDLAAIGDALRIHSTSNTSASNGKGGEV